MRGLKFLAINLGLAAAITAAVALGLIASQPPVEGLRAPAGSMALPAPADDLPALEPFTARDGSRLGFRHWLAGQEPAETLVVALHGTAGHGGQLAGLAGAIARASLADVVAPDLRGHGPAPRRRGDVDYIGQYEDDLADLIAHVAAPGQTVVLLGHSAGGGLAIRFAGGAHGGLIARAILIAPFLQYDAPTALPLDPQGWAHPLTRRIAGLTMLNAVGITALNHLTILQFRLPADLLEGPAAGLLTVAYSYRLHTGYGPRRNWQADVAALPPYLLVAGLADSSFAATAYEGAMAPANPAGRFVLVEGAGHLDVLEAFETFAAIESFLSRAD